jgi:hypothetical protein
VNISGRGLHLAEAQHVAATVLPVDDARVVVRLEADLAKSRSGRLAGSGVAAGAGTIGAALLGFGLIVAHFPLVLAAGIAMLPFAGGVGGAYALARSHRKVLSGVQLGLEQILDRLEHGDIAPAPGFLGSLTSPRMIRDR